MSVADRVINSINFGASCAKNAMVLCALSQSLSLIKAVKKHIDLYNTSEFFAIEVQARREYYVDISELGESLLDAWVRIKAIFTLDENIVYKLYEMADLSQLYEDLGSWFAAELCNNKQASLSKLQRLGVTLASKLVSIQSFILDLGLLNKLDSIPVVPVDLVLDLLPLLSRRISLVMPELISVLYAHNVVKMLGDIAGYAVDAACQQDATQFAPKIIITNLLYAAKDIAISNAVVVAVVFSVRFIFDVGVQLRSNVATARKMDQLEAEIDICKKKLSACQDANERESIQDKLIYARYQLTECIVEVARSTDENYSDIDTYITQFIGKPEDMEQLKQDIAEYKNKFLQNTDNAQAERVLRVKQQQLILWTKALANVFRQDKAMLIAEAANVIGNEMEMLKSIAELAYYVKIDSTLLSDLDTIRILIDKLDKKEKANKALITGIENKPQSDTDKQKLATYRIVGELIKNKRKKVEAKHLNKLRLATNKLSESQKQEVARLDAIRCALMSIIGKRKQQDDREFDFSFKHQVSIMGDESLFMTCSMLEGFYPARHYAHKIIKHTPYYTMLEERIKRRYNPATVGDSSLSIHSPK